jgi:hypothetical protein
MNPSPNQPHVEGWKKKQSIVLDPVCLLESSFLLENEFQESKLFFDVW